MRHGKEISQDILRDLNSFDKNIEFTHEVSAQRSPGLDLIVKCLNCR